MKKVYTKEEKQEHIKRWKEGGLSKAAYAKSVGVNKHTFYTWTDAADKANQGFVELPVAATVSETNTRKIIIEKGDIKIHVPLSVWVEGAAAVMEGLKAIV